MSSIKMGNNIIYVTNVDMGKINGAVEHINGFIKGAEKNGYQLELLSTDSLKFAGNSLSLLKKPIRIILLNFIVFYRILRRGFVQDVLYIRYSPMMLLPFIAGKITGKKIVMELNGNVDKEVFELFSPNIFFRLVISIVTAVSMFLSYKIIVVTNGLKEYYGSKYSFVRGKLHVTGNAGYANERKRNVNFTRRGIYLTTRIEWSGIKEVEELKEKLQINGIELVVKNSVSNDKNVRRFNGGDYDFGLLVYNDKTSVPRYGLCPIKYFTYLMYGIPVIVPDLPDINEITRKYEVGLIYKHKNELADKILSLYNMHDYENMSNRAYEIIQSTYNWNLVVKEIFEWIEE